MFACVGTKYPPQIPNERKPLSQWLPPVRLQPSPVGPFATVAVVVNAVAPVTFTRFTQSSIPLPLGLTRMHQPNTWFTRPAPNVKLGEFRLVAPSKQRATIVPYVPVICTSQPLPAAMLCASIRVALLTACVVTIPSPAT
jgi:hypothetical protein